MAKPALLEIFLTGLRPVFLKEEQMQDEGRSGCLMDKLRGAIFGWRHGYDVITRCALTNFFNRQFFALVGKKKIEQRARRNNNLVSVVFLDLDHLKLINDIYGHEAGDLILKILSFVVRKVLRRETDQFSIRWGGDEVVLFLPGATKEWGEMAGGMISLWFTAMMGSDRMREVLLEALPKVGQQGLNKLNEVLCRVGISYGVETWAPEGRTSLDEAIRKADLSMYERKHAHHLQQSFAD